MLAESADCPLGRGPRKRCARVTLAVVSVLPRKMNPMKSDRLIEGPT